jgi:hypothetical protein
VAKGGRNVEYRGASYYPAQKRAICAPERIAIIEASTKVGKSQGCLAWLLEQAIKDGRRGRKFRWVAPVYSQAETMYGRMKRNLPVGFYTPNQSKLTLTLATGAELEFKSGERPDALYGDDVWAAVLDEASRMREASWHAVRSTLTYTEGPARIIGNVRGRKNWFYQIARLAEAGAEGMAFARLTAYDAAEAGILSLEEIESARRDFERLGRLDVFEELYLAKASEDGGNPFGIQAIRDCIVTGWSTDTAAGAGVDLAGRGAYVVQDVSERGDRDWTAYALADRTGSCIAIERFRLPHGETENKLLAALGRIPTLMDATGAGDPIVEWCQRSGRMNVEGFIFNPRTKQDLMEGLALAIQERRIRFPDGPWVSELESFQFEYTRTGVRYSAPPGMHDDYVCAIALLVKRLPWNVGMVAAPEGMPATSRWVGVADGEAWRRYQEENRPTTVGVAEEASQVPAPPLILAPGGGKWR